TLTAMDPTTNKIVWQKRMKFPLGTGSGLLSTAAGLLFHGESEGSVVTYEIKGEQYLALLAGGSSFQLSKRGDSVWAFKLNGKVPQEPAPPEPPLTQPAPVRR